MCKYIKDGGEECGMDNHDGAFCHMHDDSDQAEEWRDEKRAAYGSVGGSQSGFEPDWTPTTCDGCESAVRVVCARLDEASFAPDKVVPTLALTCPCGDSVQYDPTWNNVPKSEIPAKWLFEDDREGAWDTENEEIVQ